MSLRAEILSCLVAVGGLGSACNDASPARAARPESASPRATPRPPHENPKAPRPEPTPDREGPHVVLEGRDGSVPVRVEVAREPPERTRGLMFRRHLDEDAGMIFLFERSELQSFWMRNTYIPLDMIFIDPELRVVGIVENAEPRTDTSRSVDQASQYVLEVNAGFSRRHGIGPGSRVRFEGFER